MSGVRVETIHRKVTEKELRIHFSKAEHGGGGIRTVYYPLFNNDAVILFEEYHTAEIVADTHLKSSIKLHGYPLFVKLLPMLQVYPVLEAQLDDTVAEFIAATEDVRDEISYYGNLEYRHDKKTNRSSIKGNWYQLEWAWSFLDRIMQHQSQCHTEIARTNRLKHAVGSEAGTSRNRVQPHKGRGDGPMISFPSENPSSVNDNEEIRMRMGTKVSIDIESRSKTRDDMPPDKEARKRPSALLKHGGRDQFDSVTYKDEERNISQSKDRSANDQEKHGTRHHRLKGKTTHVKGLRDDDNEGDDDDDDDDYKNEKEMDRQSYKDKSTGTVFNSKDEHMERRTSKGKSAKRESSRDGEKDSSQCWQIKNETRVLSDNPSDFRSLDFVVNDLRTSIYTGEIILAETEAIVNAANGSLANYGGVARAIANAASPAMQQECDDFVKRYGEVQTAGVMHTCAGGRLSPKVKYILHSVGPVWAGNQSESTCKRQLTTTFLNCLMYSNEHSVTSIALPVISSGIFGCPLELCVRAFLDAVLLFAHAHGDSEGRNLQEVHLINKDVENTAVTVVVLRQLVDQYGFDRLTQIAVTESVKSTSAEDSKSKQPRRRPSPVTVDRTTESAAGDNMTTSPSPHPRTPSVGESPHPRAPSAGESPHPRAPSVGATPSMIAPPTGLSFPKRAPSVEVSPRTTASPGRGSPSMIAPPVGLSFPRRAPSVEMPAHTMGRPLPDPPRTDTKRSGTTKRK